MHFNLREKPSKVKRRSRRKEARKAVNESSQPEEAIISEVEETTPYVDNGTAAATNTSELSGDRNGPDIEMNLTNTDDDEEAGITFGTATPFISKEYISSDNLETKQNERPLDSLSKEEFFSNLDNFKASVIKDLSSITLFDAN